jgi:3-hydroxybutyryl-CoA dehydrogenase
MMDMKKIGVIGAGTMGNGIAHLFSQHEYEVVLVDIDESFLQRGMKTIEKNMGRELKKERITQEQLDAALQRIKPVTDMAELKDCFLVIEAATEQKELKLNLFRQMDEVTEPEALLATNTSSISITEIAAVTSRPAQVIGMHFMNPVPMMKLVEVIRGLETSDAVNNQIHELSSAVGKVPVEANDFPGFVANRILLPMINEAVYAVMEGVATAEAVDQVMKLGMGHPMGPLALADLIGLDVCLAIMEVLHEGLGDSKYRPCPLLRKMVAAGRLGRKSGEGFFSYN